MRRGKRRARHYTPDVAELIRTARAHRGLTQRELAARCFTVQAAISRIERGHVSPTISTLRVIMRALDLDLTLGWQE